MKEFRIRSCEVRPLTQNRVPDLVDEAAWILQDIFEVHEPEPFRAQPLELLTGERFVEQHLPANILERIVAMSAIALREPVGNARITVDVDSSLEH